jgi:phosphoribosylaminoimidazolecarboxamide formyltransferase/IMP cyclohydrolase
MSVNIVREIDNRVEIRNVIISVSDKSGLDMFVKRLVQVLPDVKIYSTGGTYDFIKKIIPDERTLIPISDYTGQPETQGGLVKTLDFKIYLGLLTEKYNPHHQEDLRRTGAIHFDMVVVNLYPFEKVIQNRTVTIEEARANIDIGGPTMIRASAKNYLRVAVVVDPNDYESILDRLEKNGGFLNLLDRLELAKKAFKRTAEYDRYISEFLADKGEGDLGCYQFMDK